MTSKDKATAIVKQFWMKIPNQQDSYPLSIQCAIIHVKGIIEELDSLSSNYDLDLSDDVRYWQQVLTELNQM